MYKIKALLCFLVPILITFALNTKFGDIPPLLKFLNPFKGFWQNAESELFTHNRKLKLKNVKNNIEILFDDKMIPHVFAHNDHDVYYAQGYVTAMHRLWQMDFQTRFAAGRISEVVGKKAIELDRYQRRMGMIYGAENAMKSIMANPKTKEIVLAYTQGINDYIGSLKPANYPFEYKLLDFKPENWTPIKCALLLKQMSSVLAMGSDELYMTNILQKYGSKVTQELFPDYPFKEEPIIPVGTKWGFKPLIIPAAPSSTAQLITGNITTKQKEEGIGSNNWAVNGAKTISGFPILANDPHLDLTLPSIWYQIQLHAPGLNVYGVSLPGAPGVVIGFNQHIAWGVTNFTVDVLDFYQIKFKDSTLQAYLYNNDWKSTAKRIEVIKIRGGKNELDTVFYTHHGPVAYFTKSNFSKTKNIPLGNALKWIAHEQSNELLSFYLLNRGKNYDDYRKALTYFTAPAQNFIFASSTNDIAITPNGKIPLKWKNQGKFLLDGSKVENDWKGWIPAWQNPTIKNPNRNFVSSANQSPTDQNYPYYINWEFSPYDRAKRINDRLKVMNKVTADSMRNLQTDTYSITAQNILPDILPLIEFEKLNVTQKKAFEIISKWNKFFDAKAIGATIFDAWQKHLDTCIWRDDFGSTDTPMRYPSRDKTIELITSKPNSKWFNNVKTPEIETLSNVVNQSFKQACSELTKKHGSIGENWQWAKVKNTNIPHLAKIKGLGSPVLFIGGAKNTINALAESNGPSWRMVIELGKTPKGYGVYPGGQSGNPGSKYYDNMINTWAAGKLNNLIFLQSEKDQSDKIILRYHLLKK